MTEFPMTKPGRRRGILSWCLFDWANSPTSTVVITFIFAPYFTRGVVGNEAEGFALWSWGIAVSALVIAFLAPVTGAIADAAGRRKPWIAAFTALAVTCTALLWFCEPSPAWIVGTLLLVVLVNIGFETSLVFYNAMLPDVAGKDYTGRISGWAWGLGYAGGIACLVLALFVFVLPETKPFGLDTSTSEHIRILGPIVALWLIVFGWPMFAYTPDRPAKSSSLGVSISQGLVRLRTTLRELRHHRIIVRYLIARILYIDGLNTLFALGGVFAATAFGMDEQSVIMFAIALNCTACLGAAGFAWLDDRIGALRTLTISLAFLTALSAIILFVQSVMWFWIFGMLMGIFVGPVQSASRSLMAHLTPRDMEGEMFGFFALSGKITSFAGPLFVGIVTTITGSQRIGMAVILVFLITGLAVLYTLPRDLTRR